MLFLPIVTPVDLKVPDKFFVTRCLVVSIKAKRKSEDNFGRIELISNLWKSKMTGSWVNLRNLFTAWTASYLCKQFKFSRSLLLRCLQWVLLHKVVH